MLYKYFNKILLGLSQEMSLQGERHKLWSWWAINLQPLELTYNSTESLLGENCFDDYLSDAYDIDVITSHFRGTNAPTTWAGKTRWWLQIFFLPAIPAE